MLCLSRWEGKEVRKGTVSLDVAGIIKKCLTVFARTGVLYSSCAVVV